MTSTDPTFIESVNAYSTLVTAVATVVLTWVAIIQIKHRNQERKERSGQLEAAAKVQAMIARRSIFQAIKAMDSAVKLTNFEARRLEIQSVAGGLGTVEVRLERITEISIERRAKTHAASEQILRLFYRAASIINDLAEYDSVRLGQSAVAERLTKAREQLLLCAKELEQEHSLEKLSPKYEAEAEDQPLQ